MHRPNRTSRRSFIKASTAFSIPLIVPSFVLGRDEVPPSERIQFGVIGLGGRGLYLLHSLLRNKEARVIGICDVQDEHYRDNAWGKGYVMGRAGGKRALERAYGNLEGTTTTNDYLEICERNDIDAVVVATPDHWHAHCALAAIKHGKDVYGEKPVAHNFAEGKAIRDAAAAAGAIFQTGSQQRSDKLFRKAVELVINGHIGSIRHIQIGLPSGYDAPQGDQSIAEPPKGLDYERWCGPASKLPYMRARHHRWWRGHLAYGGGVLMDWIGHHNDIAHWSIGADTSGPKAVNAIDWKFPNTEVYNTPQNFEIVCEYEDGLGSSISNRNALGTKWFGEDGWIHVDRGKLTASDTRLVADDFETGEKKAYESPGHMQNFLDCIRSRSACIAPADTALRSITPGFLGYVSHQVGRKLAWDAANEKVVGDPEANELLYAMSHRAPWSRNMAIVANSNLSSRLRHIFSMYSRSNSNLRLTASISVS